MIKSIIPLSSIIALRFLGLFLVLPVIAVYAMDLKGSTPTLVGVVIGGYALTQMLFQIPFGVMSDKLGRKGTIITGLLLFFIGSVICAVANDILALMLGRFLQGAGAIGAVVTATISDLVKEEERAKAMSVMGGMIAMSFALSMFLGSTVGGYFGIEILFWITAILAIVAIVILVKAVPNPPKITHTYHEKKGNGFSSILTNKSLMKMNITNFLQKGFMTFAFMIIPMVLIKHFGWESKELFKVYIPALIFGILAMAPAAILAEKKGKFKEVLIIGILLFAISYIIMGTSSSATFFIVGVVIFFIGFNMHEPIMQSLATKLVKVHQKGSALGLFNSFGYFGTFLGGTLGGYYFANASLETIAYTVAGICLLWVLLVLTLANPKKKQNLYLSFTEFDKNKAEKLDSEKAIDEWYFNDTEELIIVKYEKELIAEEKIKAILAK